MREAKGFVLAGERQGGAYRPVARFTCAKCPATIDITIKSGVTLNGEGIAHQARHKGWAADGFNSNRTICPTCQNRARSNDPDSELKKVMSKMPAPSSAPIVVLREATPDQRANIRKLIEAHFDEDEGCYLDGFTDDRIAVECNLPRAIVERIREAAYGPIRVTPEGQALRRDIDALAKKIDGIEQAGRDLVQTIEAEVKALRASLAGLTERHKAMGRAA